MAYDKDTFRKLHSYGLTADAAVLLATHINDILATTEGLELTPAAAVDDIADTATADAEEVGDKVNELLAALRTAGLLEESEE